MHKRVDRASQRLTLFLKFFRLIGTVLAAGAIVWQLIYSATYAPGFSPWNFFSYFTIDSNVIAVVALLWAAVAIKPSSALQIFRGGATLYMVITGIVTVTLLSDLQLDLTLPAVDLILHKIIPLMMVLDWLIDPPRLRLSIKQVSLWFIFPIAWLVYTLIRGAIVGWYPYPFLNPGLTGGYGPVTLYAIGILACGIVIAAILVGLVHLTNHSKKLSTSKKSR